MARRYLPTAISLRLGASLAVASIATVTAITLTVTTLAGVTFQDSEDEDSGEADTLALEDKRVDICVEAVNVDSTLESTTADTLRSALSQVARHPLWEPAGYEERPPKVDVGCPSGPSPPVSNEDLRTSVVSGGRVVDEPGPYWLSVFILPPQHLEELLQKEGPRDSTQERVCNTERCRPVSWALYIRDDEVMDEEFLIWLLEGALGLEDTAASGSQRRADFPADRE